MKKILALLLVVVFAAALLTACGDGNPKHRPQTATEATEKATEKPTEKPTEAATEAPTEPPTEPPTEAPTEAPTEKPQALNTAFSYTDPDGEFTLTVPAIWNETGMILEEDDGSGHEMIRFVYKDAYYQGAGTVFSIVVIDDPSAFVDVTMLPHAEELYKDDSTQIFVNYPTDVQFSVYEQPGTAEFQRQQAEYTALNQTRQGVIDSFTKL